MESTTKTPDPDNQSPGGGQGVPTPGKPKQRAGKAQMPRPKSDSREELAVQQSERQTGGRTGADDDVVGGADPRETDPERGERTP